jgi:hypothetical protein
MIARSPQIPQLVGRRLQKRPLVDTVLRRREGTAELPGLDGVSRIEGFTPRRGPGG